MIWPPLSPENPWGGISGSPPELPLRARLFPGREVFLGVGGVALLIAISVGAFVFDELREEPWLLVGLGAIAVLLIGVALLSFRESFAWIEVDSEGVVARRRVGGEEIRINWTEVVSFDVQRPDTAGGAELRTNDLRTIVVPNGGATFEAVMWLLESRVLPRLVATALDHIDAGETLVFAGPEPFRSWEKRRASPKHPFEISATGFRRPSHGWLEPAGSATEIRWHQIDRVEFHRDGIIRIHTASDHLAVLPSFDNGRVCQALVAELLIRHRGAGAAHAARGLGLDVAEKDFRGRAWIVALLFGAPVLVIAGFAGWAEYELAPAPKIHQRFLENGVRVIGTIEGVPTRKHSTKVTVAYDFDSARHRIDDTLCRDAIEVGQEVTVLVASDRPDLAILLDSCTFHLERRRLRAQRSEFRQAVEEFA